MNKINSIKTTERIKNYFNIPIIYLSTFSSDNTFIYSKNTEPDTCLIKPYKKEKQFINIESSFYNLKNIIHSRMPVKQTKLKKYKLKKL